MNLAHLTSIATVSSNEHGHEDRNRNAMNCLMRGYPQMRYIRCLYRWMLYNITPVKQLVPGSSPSNGLDSTSAQFGERLAVLVVRSVQESSPDEPSKVSSHLLVTHTSPCLFSSARSQGLSIGVIQLGSLGTGGKIVQDKVQQWEQGIVLYFEDVLFELSSPQEILALIDLVTVERKSGQEVVESDLGVGSHLSDGKVGRCGRVDGRK